MHRSIAAGLAGLGLALAIPATAQEETTPRVAMTIGERISAAFAAELETLEAMDCADDDIACLSAELLERYRVDQWARGEAMGGAFCADYSGELAQNCFGQAMGATAFKVDMPNTARLKQVIALHGWPKPPLFSEAAQNAAWYLAQHAMALDGNGNLDWDVSLAESVLPQVKEAAEAGQLTPWHYAAMFDRIARARGKPQRYATQIGCADGKADFGEVEDIDRVTEFRAEIGMKAFDPDAYDAYCVRASGSEQG